MIKVDTIYTSVVKSLGLARPEAVQVDPGGIIEDRRFHLIDCHGALLTQRQAGPLVRVITAYRMDPESLTLNFPDGEELSGDIVLGELAVTTIWERRVPGRVVEGAWAAALSDSCGQPVRLVKSDLPCQCFDEYPVSLISQASIDFLGKQGGDSAGFAGFDGRRFRPNFLLGGCEPHQEDAWLGEVIRIGPQLTVQVIARDPRYAITTHHPETGDVDADTLRQILSYRPGSRVPYLGVYGVVLSPGAVSVGDPVISSLD